MPSPVAEPSDTPLEDVGGARGVQRAVPGLGPELSERLVVALRADLSVHRRQDTGDPFHPRSPRGALADRCSPLARQRVTGGVPPATGARQSRREPWRRTGGSTAVSSRVAHARESASSLEEPQYQEGHSFCILGPRNMLRVGAGGPRWPRS